MKMICIVDVETTGVDADRDVVIELGYVLWSVEHRTILEVYSGLLNAIDNAAEAVNGIPAAALPTGAVDGPWRMLGAAASRADAIVAHQASFDRSFLELRMADFDTGARKPWICTIEDFAWPRPGDSKSLVAVALRHGVGVVAAHRAVNDCLTLARLFEQLGEQAPVLLEEALARAVRPKARFVSLAPFERKDEVKAHGFHWDPGERVWWRHMAVEDAQALPFKVREQAGDVP